MTIEPTDERLALDDRLIKVDLYDGAESLIVERSDHGDYCDFRVNRRDGSTLLFVGGYAQMLRLIVYTNDSARLSVGDAHIGMMSASDGLAVARFIGVEPLTVDEE